MAIWAISDPHLPLSTKKPMDIFGGHWKNHHEKIAFACRESVKPSDILLIAGDLSWAMHLDDAVEDLQWISSLPGKKIISKGNHDYWWKSISKVRNFFDRGVYALQNDAIDVGEAVICAIRGWTVPESEFFNPLSDEKIYKRELLRLELALKAASRLTRYGRPLICMIHYPPVINARPTEFSRKLSAAGVTTCIYGHLHLAPDWPKNLDCEIEGVYYQLTSADYLNFNPVRIYGT